MPPARASAATPSMLAAVHAGRAGLLALVREGDRGCHLLASFEGAELTDAPDVVLDAVRLVSSAPPALVDDRGHAAAVSLAERWLARHTALTLATGVHPIQAPARHHAMRRIALITERAPHHRRAAIAALAARARNVVAAPGGIGAERTLHALTTSNLSDEEWLCAVADSDSPERTVAQPAAIAALLILCP